MTPSRNLKLSSPACHLKLHPHFWNASTLLINIKCCPAQAEALSSDLSLVQDVDAKLGRDYPMKDVPAEVHASLQAGLDVMFLNSAVDATGKPSKSTNRHTPPPPITLNYERARSVECLFDKFQRPADAMGCHPLNLLNGRHSTSGIS